MSENIKEILETEQAEDTTDTEITKTKVTQEIFITNDTLADAVEKMNEQIQESSTQVEAEEMLKEFTMPIIVDPSVTLIHEADPYKKIEIAGRTCYKSETKITKASAKKFVKQMITNQHTAMLEHAVFVFELDCEDGCDDILMDYVMFLQKQEHIQITIEPDVPRILVSANARTVIERDLDDPIYRSLIAVYPEFGFKPEIVVELEEKEESSENIEATETSENTKDTANSATEDNKEKAQSDEVDWTKNLYHQVSAEIVTISKIKDLTEDEFKKHFNFTVKFITDRGVSHEIVRHRKFSFAQESTRYCNYSAEKFNGHVTFCKPSTIEDWTQEQKDIFYATLSTLDGVYNMLVSDGDTRLQPQQVRAILPNATKTEIVVTGPAYEWEHFFNLRSKGTTGAPHPDMKEIADIALQKINRYIKTLKFKNNLLF